MTTFLRSSVAALLLASFFSCMVQAQGADYRDVIGFNRLASELGGALPTGEGVRVSQIEDMGDNIYSPNTDDPGFLGKIWTFRAKGQPGVADHCTSVGKIFYGTGMSPTAGIKDVSCWPAEGWVGGLLLRTGSDAEPAVERAQVENHSWIRVKGELSDIQDVLRRFDYMIDRDNVLAVAAMNNGRHNKTPQVLAMNYNAITVGLTSGEHSVGNTTVDTDGRVKPDIVAPMKAVSGAAPLVASSAVLLLDAVGNDPALADADHSEVIKALLMAGASKKELSGWKRSKGEPLDSHFGAGSLNIYNSYMMLVAGRQKSSKGSLVAAKGWDFATPRKGSQLYFFDVPEGKTAEFSTVLTWNRTVIDRLPGPTKWGKPNSLLINMTLRLYKASGFSVGPQVDVSESTIDNVQHLYQPTLAPGRYAMEVAADLRTVEYALAWRCE